MGRMRDHYVKQNKSEKYLNEMTRVKSKKVHLV